MIFYDTETCGFCGPAVLIQYARGIQGQIHLHSVWTEPIRDTLDLIKDMMDNVLVGFNMSFDHFQLCKLYTMLSLWPDDDETPESIVNELAELEPKARDGPCLKPKSALDLMLHARKGPYQSTMDRGDIRIKRVPTALAYELAKELHKRIPLKDIYFARRKVKTLSPWQIVDLEDADGDPEPDFKDIVLKFNASTALKALAVDALGIKQEEVLLHDMVSLDKQFYPNELDYAPFALAVGTKENWKGAWPEKIQFHIPHWLHNKRARQYACDDVKYLQMLFDLWKPEVGDDDSILSCVIAAVRWRGFRINIPGIRDLKEKVEKSVYKNGIKIPTAPAQARWYVTDKMNDDEKIILGGSTKKVLLQEVAKWTLECCQDPNCKKCEGSNKIPHPAAERAQDVLDARLAGYEINFLNKLLIAGRFHADFTGIGTLSGRMSGSSSAKSEEGGDSAAGINPQGVKKEQEIRDKFDLAWPGTILCGGDFAGFEVTIAEANYNDPGLRKQLLTCEVCEGAMEFVRGPITAKEYFSEEIFAIWIKNQKKPEEAVKKVIETDYICTKCGSNKGKKIHALFGVNVYPEHTYDSLKKTEGTKNDQYTNAKRGVFAMMYGGMIHTLMDRLGVPEEVAINALAKFHAQFPGVARAQKSVINKFQSMRQPGGIGSKVEWHEPADFIESMLGFRRYFTLENMICKQLFLLANDPPKKWRDLQIKVQRRDRLQTASGAVQSALYAAAFGLQGANTRAAINHEIQSTGAQITKKVQRDIWELQPAGIHDWIVQPMNIHDEIMCPTIPEKTKELKEVVMKCVESFRPKIPLIKMDWVTGLKTWAEKG